MQSPTSTPTALIPTSSPAGCVGTGRSRTGLHWVRDVTFLDDASRVHTGNAPQVMAPLRDLAISCTASPEPSTSAQRYAVTPKTQPEASTYSSSTDFADPLPREP